MRDERIRLARVPGQSRYLWERWTRSSKSSSWRARKVWTKLDHDLVELEKDPTQKELLASIFRAIHTVKGTSGVLGFPRIEAVGHVGESLPSRMRDGKLRLDPEITSGLLAMVDLLRQLLGDIAEKKGKKASAKCSSTVERLARLLESKSLQAEAAMVSPPPAPEKVRRRREKKPRPARPDAIAADSPAVPAEEATNAPASSTETSEAKGQSRFRQQHPGGRRPARQADEPGRRAGAGPQPDRCSSPHAARGQHASSAPSQRLNLITTELQEGVMKTRMQPIGNVWNKLPRVVRDLARAAAASRCASRWRARRPSSTRPSSRPSRTR